MEDIQAQIFISFYILRNITKNIHICFFYRATSKSVNLVLIQKIHSMYLSGDKRHSNMNEVHRSFKIQIKVKRN